MHIVNIMCILSTDAYVMYMSSLLLLSVYVHVIYILSGHICIMCTLSEVVLDIFLPNRQYQCHPYIISSSIYIFYHGQYVICIPSGWHVIHTLSRWCVICTPSRWRVIHTPSGWHVIRTPKKHVLPLWSLRSKWQVNQTISLIYLTFWLISLVSLTFWVFEFLGLESSCNGRR